MAVPTVTALDPASGPEGTLVTITGTGFLEDTSSVLFGTYDCGPRYSVLSDTCIAAYAPVGSGTNVDVKVTTSGGQNSTSSAKWTFDTYIGPPGGGGGGLVPTLTAVLSPATSADYHGQGGDVVTFTGTGFTTAKAVLFGSEQALGFTVISAISMTAIAPPGSGTVNVSITNEYGTSTTSAYDDFTYPVVPAPTITTFTSSGGEGQWVTITGTNFEYSDGVDIVHAVMFTGTGATWVGAPFFVDSPTSIRAQIPATTVTGKIRLYWAGGYVESTANFTSTGTVYDAIATSASGKNAIHYSTSTPSGGGISGDVWFQFGTGPDAGNIIGQWTYSGSAWVATAITNTVIANLDAGKLTAGSIAVGIGLTSPIIEGGVIRTAAVGNRRVELQEGSGAPYIYFPIGSEYSSAFIASESGSVPGLYMGAGKINSGDAGGAIIYCRPQVGATPPFARLVGGNCTVDVNSTTNVIALTAQDKVVVYAGLELTYGQINVLSGGTSYLQSVSVGGNLSVAGSVRPGANWDGGTTENGLWIQESSPTPSNRWKFYFDHTNHRLYVRLDGSTYHYCAMT